MKGGTIVVVVGLALVVGIAVGLWGGNQLAYDAARRAAREEMAKELVTVFVAAVDLRPDMHIIGAEPFLQKRIPGWAVPENAITDKRLLDNVEILRPLDAGAICTHRYVRPFEGLDRGGRPGCTMTVRVKCDQSNGMVLPPGTRVDVLATLQSKDLPTGKITKVVLSNSVLLASRFEENGKLLVTLTVTPADAERLTRYAVEENITLTILLRKPEDDVKAPELQEN